MTPTISNKISIKRSNKSHSSKQQLQDGFFFKEQINLLEQNLQEQI